MITLEQKIDLVMRHAVAEDPKLKNRLRNEIVKALSDTDADEATPCPAESTADIPPMSDDVIRDIIEDILKELGAPCHLCGYEQAIYAIKLVISDREYLDHICYMLYPAVSKKFGNTTSRVERAIRHLIEVAWNRNDLENAFRIFGYTIDANKGKPTNCEFIAGCAKEVKRRMRNMKKEG